MFNYSIFFKTVLLCFMPCAFSLQVSAQTFKTPVEYMDFIFVKQREITENHMSYTSAVAHGKSARKVDKRRKELINSNLEAIKSIQTLPDWKGDVALRDSAVSFLNTSYHILNEDYAKIMDLEDVAEQSYDQMEAYIKVQDLASEKWGEADKRLDEQVAIFAKKNNINLVAGEKTDLDKKVEMSGKVMKYQREIYLIFFKCNNQERYLVEAIKKNDLNALEQNRSALEKYATENMAKLAKIKPFNADNSIVDACRKYIQFCLKEVKEYVPATQDFYTKKENFDKLAKVLEEKGKNRNQADVDAYNKGVKDINLATNKYNASNELINKARSEAINNWNNSTQKFFDKHIPKH